MAPRINDRLDRLKSILLRVSPQKTDPKIQARQQQARSSLLHFTEFTFPQYRADPAHVLIAEALDAVVAGQVQRLMIFMGPQHGKSELTSVRLPAYWLGKRPGDAIILTSYAASLAESKSRQARQVVSSVEYEELFPDIKTQRDSRAVNHWNLEGYKGGLLAAGVGGPITGHGGMLGIIDDPIENWAMAQSDVMRDKVWEWYRTTFRTRIWEGGAIILIMTRWHEDDLAGRLLAEQPGEWEVLRLPAIAETQSERDSGHALLGLPIGVPDPLGREPGEPLCPRRFSLPALERLKRDVGSMAWAGEYQGIPRAAEGNRFKRAWLAISDEMHIDESHRAQRVRYWDKAGTAGGGCFTAGVLMAKTLSGKFWVEDVVRGQWSSLERDQIIKITAEKDRAKYRLPVRIWGEQEPGSGGKESAEAMVRLLVGFPIRVETVTGSKEVRAEPFAAQAEGGNVVLVRAPWNGPYLDELTTFPNSRFSDQVDGSSGAFNKLASRMGGDVEDAEIITPEHPHTAQDRAESGEANWRKRNLFGGAAGSGDNSRGDRKRFSTGM